MGYVFSKAFLIMESILEELEKKKCWKSSLKTQCRRNSVDPAYASCFTIVKIRKFFENPPHLQHSDKPRMKSSVWLQNQLKAYQWLLICLSAVRGVLIRDFTVGQWSQLSNIFNKEESILQYEALKLISEKQGSKRKWDQEQSDILLRIIKEQPDTNKWNEIARKLFDSSEKKFFRTGKQCRQRWLNHLDPSKKRGQWQIGEDKLIVEYILKKGKRWSDIAKHLQSHRTEHMIKNRFKTIMIRLKKENPGVRKEEELLKTMLVEKNEESKEVAHIQEKHQPAQRRLDLDGLPVIDGDNLDDLEEDFEGKEGMDRLNSSNYKDFELQQVITPCPIIYQSFTPTFLNTPHPLPFLCSFGKFQKNDSLFLKNN